jgi:hypothetical protein
MLKKCLNVAKEICFPDAIFVYCLAIAKKENRLGAPKWQKKNSSQQH